MKANDSPEIAWTEGGTASTSASQRERASATMFMRPGLYFTAKSNPKSLTVVDRFSKYAHFIALSHPYTTVSAARAFRRHCMPSRLPDIDCQ